MTKINGTLLRYPGGKSRAVKTILKYIPDGTKEIVSPFLGGGSVELALNNIGVTVHGYDIFKPLVAFWNSILKRPSKIADIVETFYPLSKIEFYELQRTIEKYKDDEVNYGAIFYVLNRCSFSGSTLSGGMSPNHARFTESSIKRVRESDIKRFSVNYADFKTSLDAHKNIFSYIDPPYMIKNALYGVSGNLHKDFDHYGLCEILKNRSNWLLSYNDCDEVRRMYKDYRIVELSWKYGMSKEKVSSEILIINCG